MVRGGSDSSLGWVSLSNTKTNETNDFAAPQINRINHIPNKLGIRPTGTSFCVSMDSDVSPYAVLWYLAQITGEGGLEGVVIDGWLPVGVTLTDQVDSSRRVNERPAERATALYGSWDFTLGSFSCTTMQCSYVCTVREAWWVWAWVRRMEDNAYPHSKHLSHLQLSLIVPHRLGQG